MSLFFLGQGSWCFSSQYAKKTPSVFRRWPSLLGQSFHKPLLLDDNHLNGKVGAQLLPRQKQRRELVSRKRKMRWAWGREKRRRDRATRRQTLTEKGSQKPPCSWTRCFPKYIITSLNCLYRCRFLWNKKLLQQVFYERLEESEVEWRLWHGWHREGAESRTRVRRAWEDGSVGRGLALPATWVQIPEPGGQSGACLQLRSSGHRETGGSLAIAGQLE